MKDTGVRCVLNHLLKQSGILIENVSYFSHCEASTNVYSIHSIIVNLLRMTGVVPAKEEKKYCSP